jgi:uncharacterized protein YjbI with pentapeptide repeats
MTTPSTARKAGPFNGNGSTTSFPFTFKVFAAADIAVTIANSLGVETALVLDTDYSVSLNANQETSPGGTITYPISGTPLAIGSVLAIVGDLDYDQPLDLPSGGNFSPLALENQLDRTVMQIQQLREEVERSLRTSVTTGADVELPAPEANAFIGWNSGATGLQNVQLEDLATAVAYATMRYDTFTGDGVTTQFTLQTDPATLGNMDVSVDGQTYVPGTDHTLVGQNVVFTVAPILGAEILVRYGQGVVVATADAQDVSYLPAGTGAVATTVQAKLRETVSVRDFNAVGDGVTDDTAAIQAAITSLSATGGTVFFPKGTYKTDSGVTLVSNLTLQGETGAVIKPSDSVPLWAYRGVSTNNVKVIDLTFEGTGTAFTNGNQRLLQIETGSNIEITGCNFTKAREGGVSLNGCSFAIVSNSSFTSCYGTGLTTRDGCSKITVDSCVFYLNGDTGVATNAAGRGLLFWETSNSVASNCVFEGNTEYGLRLYSQTGDSEANRNIAISNCAFRDNGTTATGKSDLYIYNEHGDTERVVVTGCTFSTRTGNTGAVMSGTNMTLSGCSFKAITPRSSNHAVSLYGATNVVCVGNVIQDFGSAFNMSASVGHVTTNCTMADNQIDGVVEFSGGGIVGTGNVISNNRIKHGGAGASDVCFTMTTANTNCSIVGNYVDSFYRGFNLASSGALIAIRNNTVVGSTGTGFFAQYNTDLSNQIIDGNGFDSAYPNMFGQFRKPSVHSFARSTFWTNVVPSSGGVGGGANVQWKVGDRAFNNTPAVGQPKSWVCTVAGAPGTWVSEGNL